MLLERAHYRLFKQKPQKVKETKSLYKRPLKPSRFRSMFALSVGLLIIIGVFIYFVTVRLSPILASFGKARAEYIATTAIYEGIRQVLSEEGVNYDNLVSFERDNEGKITAFKTDSVKMNLLKSDISLTVAEKLNALETTPIKIPIGNLIDGELLSGRGPRLTIKLVPYGSVRTEFQNVFTSVGINQSRHQVLVEVKALVGILFPAGHEEIEVSSTMTVAETVIMGSTPGSYTYVEDSESSTRGKIFDYVENR